MIIRKRLYTSGLIIGRSGRFISGLLIFMQVLLCLGSCVKEEFIAEQLSTGLQINPGIATPIGWARYQMEEIIDSIGTDSLYIDENGFMSLIYSKDLFSLKANEIIEIQDLPPTGPSINNPFGVSTDLSQLPEPYTFDTILSINLPIDGTTDAAIDSILFRYAEMTLSVSAPLYPQMIWSARIGIEGIPDWQATLSDIDNSVTDTLDGTSLPLDNTAPNSNALVFNVIITLWDTLVTINPGPILDLSISLTEIDYRAIYGYLGNFEIDMGPETYPLDFFKELAGGTFHFTNPQLSINFLNSFGLPINIDLTNFYGSESGGQEHFITTKEGEAFKKTLLYPLPGEEGLTLSDNLTMDASNSNLADVVSQPLSSFTVYAIGSSNPEGPPRENFILDTSQLSVSTQLILPLEGKTVDTLSMADTMRFVFTEYFDNPPEEITRLIFRVQYTTQFPVDVLAQVYFCDENYTIVEKLFDENNPAHDALRTVKGAAIGENGIALVTNSDPIDIELTTEQINNIAGSHYIIVTGKAVTSGGEEGVRFYDYYFIKTYLGVIAELELNSEDY